jgi:zinc protease
MMRSMLSVALLLLVRAVGAEAAPVRMVVADVEVILGTNPANTQTAIDALVREVKRLRDTGITQRERDEAVAYLTGRFPLRLETNAGMADVLWAMEFYRLGADYLDRYADQYRAVTVAQANEAARKHLQPGRATVVIAGPPGEGAVK